MYIYTQTRHNIFCLNKNKQTENKNQYFSMTFEDGSPSQIITCDCAQLLCDGQHIIHTDWNGCPTNKNAIFFRIE